jgi:hypothetical protein
MNPAQSPTACFSKVNFNITLPFSPLSCKCFPKGGDHSEDLGVDGRIILKMVLREIELKV